MIYAESSRSVDTGHRRGLSRRAARAQVRGRVVSVAGGFTLTEILVAIALILIIGSLSVYNFVGMANSVDKQPPPKVLQSMIREGRFMAMERMSPVVLTYNGDTHTFDLLDKQGNILEKTPDGVDDDQANITLKFTPVLPLKDMTSDPNVTDDNSVQYSTQPPLPDLVFDPSGASAPVKVTLSKDQTTLAEYRLDPFSEGPPPKAPENIPPMNTP